MLLIQQYSYVSDSTDSSDRDYTSRTCSSLSVIPTSFAVLTQYHVRDGLVSDELTEADYGEWISNQLGFVIFSLVEKDDIKTEQFLREMLTLDQECFEAAFLHSDAFFSNEFLFAVSTRFFLGEVSSGIIEAFSALDKKYNLGILSQICRSLFSNSSEVYHICVSAQDGFLSDAYQPHSKIHEASITFVDRIHSVFSLLEFLPKIDKENTCKLLADSIVSDYVTYSHFHEYAPEPPQILEAIASAYNTHTNLIFLESLSKIEASSLTDISLKRYTELSSVLYLLQELKFPGIELSLAADAVTIELRIPGSQLNQLPVLFELLHSGAEISDLQSAVELSSRLKRKKL